MSDETYNGWKNRETWAFNLHWSNTESFYHQTRAVGEREIRSEDEDEELSLRDYRLGEAVIAYWRDLLDEWPDTVPMSEDLKMFEKEVGSWWRVDEAETGAAVRESLE